MMKVTISVGFLFLLVLSASHAEEQSEGSSDTSESDNCAELEEFFDDEVISNTSECRTTTGFNESTISKWDKNTSVSITLDKIMPYIDCLHNKLKETEVGKKAYEKCSQANPLGPTDEDSCDDMRGMYNVICTWGTASQICPNVTCKLYKNNDQYKMYTPEYILTPKPSE